MPTPLPQRDARVVLVSNSPTAAQTASDVLKELGFRHVSIVNSLNYALGLLEVDEADWLLSPVTTDAETDANILQVLQLCLTTAPLRHLKVSLLINSEPENDLLLHAFSKGLLSWHAWPAPKSQFKKELEALLHTPSDTAYDPCLVSAAFIRELLTRKKETLRLEQLETALFDLYPTDQVQVLRLADAKISLGKFREARSILAIATALDRSLQGEAQSRLDHCDANMVNEANPAPAGNLLEVDYCVIVDPDDAVRLNIEYCLEDLGVKQVHHFIDSDTAWAFLENNGDNGLVFMEWMVSRVNGQALLQRIRLKHRNLPVIVISAQTKAKDKPLLNEMGVDALLLKPFGRSDVIAALLTLKMKRRQLSTWLMTARQCTTLMAKGKVAEAYAILNAFTSRSGVSPVDKALAKAVVAYEAKDFHQTIEICSELIKGVQEIPLKALDLIGKSLFALRQFANAIAFFKKASAVSPENIERLCSTAEAAAHLDSKEEANAALEKTKKIDPDNPLVVETDVKCFMMLEGGANGKALASKLKDVSHIVAFINNQAVAYTVAGETERGIALYERALATLPDSASEARLLVSYNLALALARKGDLSRALEALESPIAATASLEKKRQSLKRQLQTAIKTGTAIRLNDPSPKAVEPPKAKPQQALHGSLLSAIESLSVQAGSACCYRVFNEPSPSPAIQAMVETLPRFSPRPGIAKIS